MQYFSQNTTISLEDLHSILHLCNIPTDIHIAWSAAQISLENISQFIEAVKPLYRPCFAQRFLDPIINGTSDVRSALLTVIKQIIKKEGTYRIVKREKFKSAIGKYMEYRLEYIASFLTEPITVEMS